MGSAPRRLAEAKLTRTTVASTAAALVAAALATVPALPAAPAAAEGKYLVDEPAIALARPSTVYLQVTYTGIVRDRATGAPVGDGPVVHKRRCSGVVVSPDGYAVTTTLCVQPSAEVLAVNGLNEVARVLVARGELLSTDVARWVADRAKTTDLTGAQRGQPPAVTIGCWPDGWTEGDPAATPLPVTVLRAQSPVEGNVAVVKLGRPGLPSIEIRRDDGPAAGSTVVLAGYNGDGKPGQQTFTLRTRSTRVAAGRSGTNRLSVEGGIGPQARGGAVVDTAGRLVAIQDNDSTAPGEPVRDLVKATHVNRALADAGVTGALGDVDRAYRAALREYFAGRFSTAVPMFEDVLRAAPEHRAARTYRDQAVTRRDVDGDAIVDAADWRLYGWSALAGGAGIVVLHLVMRLGRRRRRAEGARAPHAAAPVIPAQRRPPDDETVEMDPATMDDDTVVFHLDEPRDVRRR